jgi:hypothetical protein
MREIWRNAGGTRIRRSRFTMLPSIATRFGQDVGATILSFQSWVLWSLGYPTAALADAHHALKDAREIGQAATLMYALRHVSLTHIYCRNYATACARKPISRVPSLFLVSSKQSLGNCVRR